MTNLENSDRHSITGHVKGRQTVIDFGIRAIGNLRFSKMILLPKTALYNCGVENPNKARVQWVQNGQERYIKVVPVHIQTEESKN